MTLTCINIVTKNIPNFTSIKFLTSILHLFNLQLRRSSEPSAYSYPLQVYLILLTQN